MKNYDFPSKIDKVLWKISHLPSKIDETLGDITIKRSKQFVSSGEKNFRVENPDLLISRMIEAFGENAVLEKKDGVSFSFNNWRFNLRKSNTEPLLRLNVEARDCDEILKEKVTEIEKFINDYDVLWIVNILRIKYLLFWAFL